MPSYYKCYYILSKKYRKLILYIFPLFLATELFGITFDNKANNYVNFFGQKESYFLVQPPLLKKLFYEVVTLKGNPKRARMNINRKIFACPEGLQQTSICPMDQLWIQRRAKKISKTINFPVNFRSVNNKRLKRSQYLLKITWSAEQYTPPLLEIDQFFEYINVQNDSIFFKKKDEIRLIQLSVDFEENISLIVSKKTALNLTKLYKVPKTDFKDRISLHYDSANMFYFDGIEYLRTYWKAHLIQINHQRLKIPVVSIE